MFRAALSRVRVSSRDCGGLSRGLRRGLDRSCSSTTPGSSSSSSPSAASSSSSASQTRLKRMQRFQERQNTAHPGGEKPAAGPSGPGAFEDPLVRAGALISVLSLGALAISKELATNKDGTLGKMYWGSPAEEFFNTLYDYTFGYMNSVMQPTNDKLLPDWGDPMFYPNIPPGSPAPPTLVLDIENTCIGSVYDAKTGWRHVKRPGVDEFIAQLCNYYEIVLLSENDIGTSEKIFLALDPKNQCHRHGSGSSEIKNNVVMKRLDIMNRDIKKIVLIDDDEKASQLFPRNTLLVKPYTDVYDRNDRVLYDLIPLLQAIVHDNPPDIRDTLDDLGTNDAEEAATEYSMRLHEHRQREYVNRNKGLGGLIRAKKKVPEPKLEGFDDDDDDMRRSSSRVMSASQIVGSDPDAIDAQNEQQKRKQNVKVGADRKVIIESRQSSSESVKDAVVTKKKGGAFQWYETNAKEAEEVEMRKREKLNEIYQKKMIAKQAEEEAKAQQQRR